MLARAVNSVLDQAFQAADFEVIVVNDSGQRLPEAVWRQSPRVQVVDTYRRERSVARNAGAALARGRYLHFLDDDDWLVPGALGTLWQLAQTSEAGWLYGATELVDRNYQPLLKLRPAWSGNCFVHAMAGEWIPLQSSMISSQQFFGVGGFNPQIAGPEDNDLLRRLTLHTSVAGVQTVVACVGWGAETSTTPPRSRHAQHSRWAREQILSQPDVFARMRASATTSAWSGRIVRIYLTSAIWNVQHRRPLTAASRVLWALAGLGSAGPRFISPEFWGALARPYDSATFRHGRREAAMAR